jgi:hypothetical protein
MRLDPETQHRSILPLLAVGLAAVYLFVFVPLDRKAVSLDTPLAQSWQQLATALGQTNALELDFASLTNEYNETRSALTVFETARQQARARVELDEDLRARIGLPFLLVEYKNEAGRRMDALTRLAKQENVVLEPAVLAGFPEQSSDMREPALLWAELAFLDSLLNTAIHAKVTTIHFAAAQLPLTNAAPVNNGRSLAGLPLQIELTGPAQNVSRFLQTLPLRGDEITAAGLPESPTNKPALFMDRLVLRKQSPQKPDEVRLSLRAVGFVFQK